MNGIKTILHYGKRTRKRILYGIKIVLATLILYVLIDKISLQQITGALRHARLDLILLSLALLPLNIFFQFRKWRLLVHLVKPAAWTEILASLLAGFSLGLITPGRLGEFGRSVFIKNSDWKQLTGLIVIDKLFAMVMVYLFGLIGFRFFLEKSANNLLWRPVLVALILLLLLIIFLILHPDIIRAMLVKVQPRLTRFHFIEQLTSAYGRFSRRHAYALFGWAICHVFTYLLQFYILINAFAYIGLVDGFLAVASAFLAKTLLPISFGDLGVRESAAIYFFSQFGISRAAAFNASFLLFLINILLPSIVGMLVILFNRYVGKNIGLNT